MTLAALLAAIAVLVVGLAGGSSARWLARRDHRCVLRAAAAGCAPCAEAGRPGAASGGHVVCACGAASPHLLGADLLRWRAEHQGERFPALPGEPVAATRGPAAVLGDDLAQAQAFDRLADGQGEAQRRAIARARANPDPVTPQVLREAGLAGLTEPTGLNEAAPQVSPAGDGDSR